MFGALGIDRKGEETVNGHGPFLLGIVKLGRRTGSVILWIYEKHRIKQFKESSSLICKLYLKKL